MAPLAAMQTPLEQMAIIILLVCLVGSVGIVTFCFSQLLRKRTPYTTWLSIAAMLLLVAQIFAVIRCFCEEGTQPLIITNFSLPIGVCSITYFMTEVEYYLLTCEAMDVRDLRKRIMAGLLFGFTVCWTLRVLNDYRIWTPGPPLVYVDLALVSLYLLVMNSSDVVMQLRIMYKIQNMLKDAESKRRYLIKIGSLLSVQVLYIVSALGLYAASYIVASSSRRAYLSLLVMSISVPTVHFGLCVMIMETGRHCLIEARRSSSPGSIKKIKTAGQTKPRSMPMTIIGPTPTAVDESATNRHYPTEAN
ncbi:hypothetical protein BC831DRAFT_192047 [Entophlyctis helioformis]|nr:hypothetical protein BC831DRAFT_192047 [Entophlyctis helioformis]